MKIHLAPLRTILLFLTLCSLTAHAQEKIASLDTAATTRSLSRAVNTTSMDRSFVAPKAGRVYNPDRAFVVETSEDGTVTEMPYVVIPILFKKNTAELLDTRSGENLRKLADVLKAETLKDGQFQVEGHTCTDGEETHNQSLSQKRAAVIRAELLRLGVAAGRLTAVRGFGESAPEVTNDTEVHKQQNRRVAVVRVK